MTTKEKIRELKRPKLKIIVHEVIGTLYNVLPRYDELDTLESYLEKFKKKEVDDLYQEVCQAVFNAAALGTEEQYGLNEPDTLEYKMETEKEQEKFFKVYMKELNKLSFEEIK